MGSPAMNTTVVDLLLDDDLTTASRDARRKPATGVDIGADEVAAVAAVSQ